MVDFEIKKVFNRWAKKYDKSVKNDKWLFYRYEYVLNLVVKEIKDCLKPRANILEIGCGTGNLTIKLIRNGYKVICIEPSVEMVKELLKKIDKETIDEKTITILGGNFLNIPSLNTRVQAIVSTYAWHHIADTDKLRSIDIMDKILDSKNGIIVIADFMFNTLKEREKIIKHLLLKKEFDKIEDIKSEHYANLEIIKSHFKKKKFELVKAKKITPLVWLIVCKKVS